MNNDFLYEGLKYHQLKVTEVVLMLLEVVTYDSDFFSQNMQLLRIQVQVEGQVLEEAKECISDQVVDFFDE